jgi:hypothetical protein
MAGTSSGGGKPQWTCMVTCKRLNYFEGHPKDNSKQCKCIWGWMDVRILGTAPMRDSWNMNNYAIASFNAAMRQIIDVIDELHIDFTDVFMLEYPCKDDIARVPQNSNHYFQRYGNKFAGNVGEYVYFAEFFGKICKTLT